MNLIDLVCKELKTNDNRLSLPFIDSIADKSKVEYFKLTENTRVCVMILPTGHELVGVAQVLDAVNDVEELGNTVALGNAKDQLWKLCGTIAKLYV